MTELAGRRLREAIVRAAGCPADILDRSGTTVAPDDQRAGTNQVAFYQIGSHAMLWCDPVLADRLGALASDTATLADDTARSWTLASGGQISGQAVMKTRASEGRELSAIADRPHRFDWASGGDLERIERFVAVCDPEDLDEAEIALDDLDDMAVGLLDNNGEVVAYASSRPFGYEPSFGDIGVAVRTGMRGQGRGRTVVATLIVDLLAPAGIEPLYRCDPENIGSDRLSQRLGFESVVSLTAAQFAQS